MNRFFVYHSHLITDEQYEMVNKFSVHTLLSPEQIKPIFGKQNTFYSNYFVCPIAPFLKEEVNIFFSTIQMIDPLFEKRKNKYIFFDMIDEEYISPNVKNSILFKVSTKSNFGMYYPLNKKYVAAIKENWFSIEKASFDVSFQGTLTTSSIREQIVLMLHQQKELKYYLKILPQYFFDLKERKSYFQDYVFSILNTKFVFCPRGNGLSSYRLYETLAAGRIPIIYSDGLKLPLQDLLPWDKFSIKIPENEINNTIEYINQFKRQNNIDFASKLALFVWNKYFSPNGLKNFLNRSLNDSFL